jgi:hypothetical protein
MSKALKINSLEKKIEIIEINHYKEIYNHIGNNCQLFACPITFDNNDGLLIDDERLYHEFEAGFIMDDWAYPVVGNAVIQGCDEDGETCDVKTTVEELTKLIKWVSKEDCEKWQQKAIDQPFVFIPC